MSPRMGRGDLLSNHGDDECRERCPKGGGRPCGFQAPVVDAMLLKMLLSMRPCSCPSDQPPDGDIELCHDELCHVLVEDGKPCLPKVDDSKGSDAACLI